MFFANELLNTPLDQTSSQEVYQTFDDAYLVFDAGSPAFEGCFNENDSDFFGGLFRLNNDDIQTASLTKQTVFSLNDSISREQDQIQPLVPTYIGSETESPSILINRQPKSSTTDEQRSVLQIKQTMSKVIAISVNGGPFLGTERNKSTTYVNINLTTIRIEIGKLMHPMKAPYQEFLKSLGMTVAEEECIEAHVNRDAQQDIKSAIQVSLCDITETNLDQIPQIRISNNRIGLLSFTCLQLRKDEVKMDEKESSYNIPLTFADRLARITGHSPDSSQIDPHRNSTLKTGQKTRTISILVERNYKVFGTWAKAFSDRLESHCAPQKHGHQPFV